MSSLAHHPDPTVRMVDGITLGPGELALGTFLLGLSLLFEMLATGINAIRNKSDNRGVTVRNAEKDFRPAYSQGYPHQSGKYIELDGLPRVHYLDVGPKNATQTLLLLHGEPFWSQCWTRVIPIFVREGYRVIAPDFIGFGKSDKLVDYRDYNMELHKSTLKKLLKRLNLSGQITLVGHNWGWMIGAAVAKDWPGYFTKQVILNTNNLPDGEADLDRFEDKSHWFRFMVANSFFLVFRSSMNLLQHAFPLELLIRALNSKYDKEDVSAMLAPYRKAKYCGGTTAFPLMVPVVSGDREAREMRWTRLHLAKDPTPTILAYSENALLPWIQQGDFVVGNRPVFYERLLPNLQNSYRIKNGGHLIMYDQPKAVAEVIIRFLNS